MTPPVKNLVWAKYPFGDVTQWFAENKKLYEHMELRGHNGIDIVRPHGEHMFAVENAVVARVKDDDTGYGKHVRLMSLSKGLYREWTYGHMSFIAVKEGQQVNEGQYIGDMGNTGFVVSDSTGNGYWGANPYKGTHVHFGLRVLKKDPNGWSYGSNLPKCIVLDYSNGYKGAVNPLPYFVDVTKKSWKVGLYAQASNDKTLWNFSKLLAKLGL